jgi:hypothetical protein
MIDESVLNYQRGTLVEFKLTLGGGPLTSRGLILNTGVLFGRSARQVWILEIDGGTDQQRGYWLNRKHLVHEDAISCSIPSVVIGHDTLLRDNPVCYPVQDVKGNFEIPAIVVTAPCRVAETKS